MGTITTLYCDRCKKKLRYDPLFLPLTCVRIWERTSMRIVFRPHESDAWNERSDVELCRDCAKALYKWMNTPTVEVG